MSRVQIPVVAQDAAGNAVAAASITIVNRQTGQAPVVYTTETGGSARSLPLTTVTNGRPPESWVDRAAYLITVSAAAIGTDTLAWDAADARDEAVDAAWLAQSQRWMPGDVKQTTRSAAPPGWLKAIGATLARADYPALWAVAQAEITAGNQIYGPGDGSTTFTVADLSRRVLVGAGSGGGLAPRALGASGGAEAHTLSTNELAAHDHPHTDGGHAHSASQSSHSHSASQSVHSHTFIDDVGNYAAIKHLGGGNPTTRNVASGAGFNGGDLRTAAAQPSVSIGSTQPSVSVSSSTTGIDIGLRGGGQSHNNMPPFVTVHTLIKT